jgi:hypothetical protein
MVVFANLNTFRIIQSEEWRNYPFGYNGCFAANCNNRLIIGGGSYLDGKSTMKVFEEYDSWRHMFQAIMPLNHGRTGASAAYSRWHRKLIIAGGTSTYLDDYTLYDLRDVELLDIAPSYCPSSDSSSASRWIRWVPCKDKIPGIFGSKVEVFAVKDKIVLADFEYNKLYEGRIVEVPQHNVIINPTNSYTHRKEQETAQYYNTKFAAIPRTSIMWKGFPELLQARKNHSITVLGDRLLVCIGGHTVFDNKCVKTCEYFSYRSNTWNVGPELPFCLLQAQILPLEDQDENSSLRCIIVGGERDHVESRLLSLFDLEKGNITNFKDTLPKSLLLKYIKTKDSINGTNNDVAIML